MMSDSIKTPLVAVAMLLAFPGSQKSFAGPPFVTDDPEPVEYKHWEV